MMKYVIGISFGRQRLMLIVSIRTSILLTTPLGSPVSSNVDGVKALLVSWKVSESA